MDRKITKDSPDWHDSPDAMVWAEKFVETLQRERAAGNAGADPEDAGFMVGWFANAMFAGERHALRNYEQEKRLRSASDSTEGKIVIHTGPA